VNVTIVGAGIIGCASAYELARRGCHVDVIDMRAPGRGATHASAGILAPYIEGQIEPVLRLGIASLAMYPDFVERVSRDAGRELEFRRCGTLQAARTGEEHERLAAAAERLSALGVTCELTSGDAARRLEPAIDEQILSALVIPEHGYVRVSDMMAALVSAGGGRVAFHAGQVREVESGASGVTLQMATGDRYADILVIAAGSWSSSLSVPAVPVKPIRGQIVELRFPQRPFSRVVWGESCYMVPWCDGTVLVGATAEDAGFDESVVPDATRRLIGAARRLVPAAADATVHDVRVGLRPSTPDELPVIGRSSTMPRVVYATGHYRHGILMAPLTAKLLADIVMDERPDPLLDLVRPARFAL
jgi:glycine oxidase